MIENDYAIDLLSEATKKERRNLLAASAISIIIVKTGLVPTKIAAFGIEFSSTERVTLLRCLAGVVCYFLFAFLIYAADDYVASRHAAVKRVIDMIEEPTPLGQMKVEAYRQIEESPRHRRITRANDVLGWARNLLDFVLPVVIGLYSLWVLLAG